MSNVTTATIDDLADLVRLNNLVQALHADLYPDFFKPRADETELEKMFSALLADQAHIVAVHRDGGLVKGYIWFEVQDLPQSALTFPSRRIYVHHISVTDTDRRRGIGADLIGWVEAYAASLGIRQMAVDHWLANSAAQSFFLRSGFSPVRIIMRKHLPTAD
jgi:ribosomal protein S18 acetylase RimI-like enzyme